MNLSGLLNTFFKLAKKIDNISGNDKVIVHTGISGYTTINDIKTEILGSITKDSQTILSGIDGNSNPTFDDDINIISSTSRPSAQVSLPAGIEHMQRVVVNHSNKPVYVTTNDSSDFGTSYYLPPNSSQTFIFIDGAWTSITRQNVAATQSGSATTAVIMDATAGVINTQALSTPPNSVTTFTVTNKWTGWDTLSVVVACITRYTGTIGTQGLPYIYLSDVGYTGFKVNIVNAHPTNNLGGYMTISFIIK